VGPPRRRPAEAGAGGHRDATNLATATALLNSVSLMELYAASTQSSLEDR
jgi:hypothetical protein